MKDTIYREDAMEAVWKPQVKPNELIFDALKRAIESEINNLPSADRPQGEWKPKNHHTDYCSNCGFEETQWRTADYNFCPSCGARMKGVDDEHTV